MKFRCHIVAALAAVPFVGWCAGKSYQTDSLNPQHLQELRISINQCAAQVQNAPDAATRCKCQEQLCKRLIQAQDYDAALQVATEVAQSPGADPERRAAHHFMIAQIYALKMEASPNADLMQQNRTKAINSAQQVLAQGYPAKWMVNDAATKLYRELQDPNHMAEVQAWVSKRQSGGGADAGKIAAARAQSASIAHSVGGSSSPTTPVADRKGFSSLFFLGSGRSGSTVSDAGASTTQVPSLSKLDGDLGKPSAMPNAAAKKMRLPGGEVTFSNSSKGFIPPTSAAATAYSTKNALSSPIMINGSIITNVPATEAVQDIAKAWPVPAGAQTAAASGGASAPTKPFRSLFGGGKTSAANRTSGKNEN